VSRAVALGRGECLRLLAAGVIGRVVVTDAALPDVHQVNYLLDDEEVIFRTRNGSKLAAATRNAVVGFQIDHHDVSTRSGWSVLASATPTRSSIPPGYASSPPCSHSRGCPGTPRTPSRSQLKLITGRRLETDQG